jgi:uncharacterized protein YjiS (DUF1127 family)
MAVLTETLSLEKNTWDTIDRQAAEEKLSREEFVQKAIQIYERRKALEELRKMGRELSEIGITEKEVAEALKEVRAEKKNEASIG